LAPRYEPRHFPFVNLARVYRRQGRVVAALGELVAAQELEPKDPSIAENIEKLRRFS
jgi:Flp pilus assembly protein TadD